MANRTKLTLKKKRAFFEHLATTANVTDSAALIGMRREYLYEVRRNDEVFRGLWDAAVELGTRSLEDEAARRAKVGWEEPVFYQGSECGRVRKFSDTLLIFLLKARDAKYKDQQTTTLRTEPGNPVEVSATMTADDSIKELLRRNDGN